MQVADASDANYHFSLFFSLFGRCMRMFANFTLFLLPFVLCVIHLWLVLRLQCLVVADWYVQQSRRNFQELEIQVRYGLLLFAIVWLVWHSLIVWHILLLSVIRQNKLTNNSGNLSDYVGLEDFFSENLSLKGNSVTESTQIKTLEDQRAV